MITFFKEGGFSMYPVLAFGLVALLAAFWFALRPAQPQRGFVKHMAGATLFAVLCGAAANLATVAHAAGALEGQARAECILVGFAESMRPAILGFSVLALVSLLRAVGERRLAVRTISVTGPEPRRSGE